MPRKKKTTVRVAAVASKSTSVDAAFTAAPDTIVDAPNVIVATPSNLNHRPNSIDLTVDSNSRAVDPSLSSPSTTQATLPSVVTPAKPPSSLKREIQAFDEAIARATSDTAQKKPRTKIGITAVDFSSSTGLTKAFKALKGDYTTMPEARLDLIKAILNSYVMDDLKVLWKSRSTDKLPSRKADAVTGLTQILSNEYHVRTPPVASKDVHTSM